MPNKGFSLADLVIIVLMIVGLLASVAIPHMLRGKEFTTTFKLSEQKIVKCKYSTRANCGLTLSDCEDGNRYECMQNVIRVHTLDDYSGRNYQND